MKTQDVLGLLSRCSKNPTQNQNCPILLLHQIKRLSQQEAGIQRREWGNNEKGPFTEKKINRVWTELEPGVLDKRVESTGGKHEACGPNPALLLVLSTLAPCFYLVAAPSSCFTVKE